jgi:hypothetical protein
MVEPDGLREQRLDGGIGCARRSRGFARTRYQQALPLRTSVRDELTMGA